MKPSGSIQKPRMGRKPRNPHKMRATPSPIRAMRERGKPMLKEPSTSLPLA